MNFVIITKQELQKIPPIISVAYILKDLGHNVHIISCGITNEVKEELSQRNISSEEYPLVTAKNRINKIYQYLKFRSVVKKRLRQLEFDYLWIEAGYTIRAMGTFFTRYKFILQISELHEGSMAVLKSIGRVIHKAKLVFMPEYNRSFIYKGLYHLNQRPIVLPNKPYYIPSVETLKKLEGKYEEYVPLFKKYKVILYQGLITSDRDLSAFAAAIKNIGNDYRFVLMGKDFGCVNKYKQINPDIIHIEYITPPDYLLFTSMSYIGIMCYDPIVLNNAFCAPNKMYEYSAFGKPIVGNNIPGLKVLEQSHLGITVEMSNSQEIIDAILCIENNYDSYSKAASVFYEDCQNEVTIKNAINSLERNS